MAILRAKLLRGVVFARQREIALGAPRVGEQRVYQGTTGSRKSLLHLLLSPPKGLHVEPLIGVRKGPARARVDRAHG